HRRIENRPDLRRPLRYIRKSKEASMRLDLFTRSALLTSPRTLAPAFATISLVVACGGADNQDVLASSAGGTSASGSSGSSGAASSGGVSTDGGAPCTHEEESNDTDREANELAPSRCGMISTPNDVDVLTCRLDPLTRRMSPQFQGRVTLTVVVEGKSPV